MSDFNEFCKDMLETTIEKDTMIENLQSRIKELEAQIKQAIEVLENSPTRRFTHTNAALEILRGEKK